MLPTTAVLIATLAVPASDSASFDSKGRASVRAALGKGRVVEVTAMSMACCVNIPFHTEMFWGSDLAPPERILRELSVAVDGQRLHLPFSAFGDLGEPTDLAVSAGDVRIIVNLRGGQTATGYEATLMFEFNRKVRRFLLTKRRVWLRTFPDTVWAETRYSWNTLNN